MCKILKAQTVDDSAYELFSESTDPAKPSHVSLNQSQSSPAWPERRSQSSCSTRSVKIDAIDKKSARSRMARSALTLSIKEV